MKNTREENMRVILEKMKKRTDTHADDLLSWKMAMRQWSDQKLQDAADKARKAIL